MRRPTHPTTLTAALATAAALGPLVAGPATATEAPTAALAAPGCQLAATIETRYPQGYHATLTLRNTGPTAWDGWELTIPRRSAQDVAYAWNSVLVRGGDAVVIRDAGWNGSLAPGETTEIGVVGRLSPGAVLDVSGASVDGEACGG